MSEQRYLIYGTEPGEEPALLFNFSSTQIALSDAQLTVKDLESRGVTDVRLSIVDTCPACGEMLQADLNTGCVKGWCRLKGKV